MASNVRFESSSASSEDLAFPGNYTNGQKGSYSTASLDRSGSFREGSEGRVFSSGTSMSRGSAAPMGDVPSLSQWLNLDPITVADQKYTRLGELRRVLGISLASSSEDSFGAALSKVSPTVSMEELKRFRASVLDASLKARNRAKKLDESLQKLNKYCETLNSKKQTNERSGGSNLLKMGTLMQRDLVTPRLEDRTKNVVLNKRIRSSIAEIRAEGRNNNTARLPILMGKDKETKDAGDGSEMGEEKIRRLPAGGEGWDRKMKRRRSVGAVFTRSVDNDGEIKRVMHHKLSNEPGVQSFDSQGFSSCRSGSFNGTNCVNKLENTSLPSGSNIRGIPKNEMEKVSLSRDFTSGTTKERILAKGNNKLNIREDCHVVGPGMVTKGKASRASRTSPVTATNSSSFSRPSGAIDGWEQPPSGSKAQLLGATNNRKRPIPPGSSSPPMTQWVGQRLQKMSRTRRTNLVAPVSSHDEMQLPPEGCPSSDLNGRITSGGTNSSLLGRVMSNVSQQVRVKHENISSPARLSESEESGVGENRDSKLREKGLCSSEVEERAVTAVHNVGPSVLLSKKNKILSKEDIGDGVRRQGRSSRGSSYNRASVSPLREKLDNTASTKPLKNARLGPDKIGSKSGRPPLKKVSDRKAFTRVGVTPTSSPDLTGELDDDREELLAAANFACNASYLACSNSFWKKMELIFSSSFEDITYLRQQLKLTEELHESSCQIYGHGSHIVSDRVHEEGFPSQNAFSGERRRSLHDGIDSDEPTRNADLDDQVQGSCTFSGRLYSEGKSEVTPLYQRVLSSLIMEDESLEYEENSDGRNMSLQYNKNNSSSTTGAPVDIETGKSDRIGLENDSMLGLQDQKQYPVSRSFCNGSVSFGRMTSIKNELCSEDYFRGGHGCINSEIGMLPELHRNCNGPLSVETESSDVSSFDCQYEKICLEDKFILELQSIGIFVEPVPDLADGEDEMVDQEIIKLQRGLQQQVAKKNENLNKILKAMEEVTNVNERVEEVAMNRLVELAYRKRLATRGSTASKSGVTKVSKQVAMAFIKRTLARCHKFEETGKSCFSDPAIRDVLFAVPAWGNDAEYASCFGSAAGINMQPERRNSLSESGLSVPVAGRAAQHDIFNDKVGKSSFYTFGTLGHASDQEFAKTGPILNKGKKKEVLLDDVGGTTNMRMTSSLGNTLSGGTKGKRSEREREKDSSVKNSVAKSGRVTLVNFKGERKTKSKPKQKTAQLTSSGNGFVNKLTKTTDSVYSSASGSGGVGTNSSDKKREVGFHDNVRLDSSQECKEPIELQLQDFDSIGLGGDWFNFDDDGLQDHEDGLQDTDLMGLEIPMDDLSELNMF